MCFWQKTEKSQTLFIINYQTAWSTCMKALDKVHVCNNVRMQEIKTHIRPVATACSYFLN